MKESRVALFMMVGWLCKKQEQSLIRASGIILTPHFLCDFELS